ncbi:MAG: hypothetical protein Q8M01_17825 [Rubrivivax sp.]|nr:hypothetical protein [Rubrivivax sp.]
MTASRCTALSTGPKVDALAAPRQKAVLAGTHAVKVDDGQPRGTAK